MTLDAAWAVDWTRRTAATVAEHRDELVELDRQIGDGDHGENLTAGSGGRRQARRPRRAARDIGDVLRSSPRRSCPPSAVPPVRSTAPPTCVPRSPGRDRAGRPTASSRCSRRRSTASSRAARRPWGRRRWSTRGPPAVDAAVDAADPGPRRRRCSPPRPRSARGRRGDRSRSSRPRVAPATWVSAAPVTSTGAPARPCCLLRRRRAAAARTDGHERDRARSLSSSRPPRGWRRAREAGRPDGARRGARRGGRDATTVAWAPASTRSTPRRRRSRPDGRSDVVLPDLGRRS